MNNDHIEITRTNVLDTQALLVNGQYFFGKERQRDAESALQILQRYPDLSVKQIPRGVQVSDCYDREICQIWTVGGGGHAAYTRKVAAFGQDFHGLRALAIEAFECVV